MTFSDIVSAIGFTTMFGCLIYIGRKLQILEDLQNTTTKVKTNLKIVSDFLTSNSIDFNHTELQSYSPLKLTAEGSKLIEKIGFDDIFAERCADFYEYIDGEDPVFKYDVERAAIKSISALYNKDYMNFLKIWFYNNPTRSLKNIAPTLGVYIRDQYLIIHPEIIE